MYKLVLLLFLLFLSACSGSDRPQTMEERVIRELDFTSEVHFQNSDGTQTISTIRVAVADDDHSRSEGLMNIHSLPSDAGMLFIFEDDQHRSFWMANTPISLDILYVNSDFEIVRIHRNTPPYSQEQIRSEAPAKYVVEVNAGYSLRNDITEGMRISIDGLE